MNYTNLQEYYGRFNDGEGSRALFVMLLSYEYATDTIRFHFNMKEPGFAGEDEAANFAETDVQWNTQLNLKKPEDKILVSEE